MPLWLWRLFLHVNLCITLSFLFSGIFFSFALSSSSSWWQVEKRLQKTRGRCAHGITRQKQSAGWTLPRLSFSDTVCLSFHPHDLARRQTYASELLRTIWASTFCQGMYVGFWRRLTSVTCYYVLLFVWGERHGEGWVIRSLRIDFLFLSESCEAAKWCGFANACVFRCILKMQFCMVS